MTTSAAPAQFDDGPEHPAPQQAPPSTANGDVEPQAARALSLVGQPFAIFWRPRMTWRLVLTAMLVERALAQPIDPQLLMQRVQIISDTSAVCNNGARAAFYYRNCSANWDRHAGGVFTLSSSVVTLN